MTTHDANNPEIKIITAGWKTEESGVLSYGPETAGGRMIQHFPIAYPYWSVNQTAEFITRNVKKFETLNYIYVIDNQRKLLGVVSLKELLQADKRKKIDKIVPEQKIVTVHPEADQETVVYLATKAKVKQIPVVDENQILLGVVPSEALLNILSDEFSEDILRVAGAPEFERDPEKIPVFKWTAMRLPWLVFGMAGGIAAGSIIGIFRPTLESFVMLAVYIPVMMKTGGDISTQTSTVLVRALSLRREKRFLTYFTHELKSAMILGVIWSAALFGISMAWQKFLPAAIGASIAVFLTTIFAVFAGTAIPFAFKKMNIDPALASTPLITTIQDISGVLLYLGSASFFINLL